MKLKEEGKAINILVTPEMYDALKEESKKKFISMGGLIRMILVERYLPDGNGRVDK